MQAELEGKLAKNATAAAEAAGKSAALAEAKDDELSRLKSSMEETGIVQEGAPPAAVAPQVVAAEEATPPVGTEALPAAAVTPTAPEVPAGPAQVSEKAPTPPAPAAIPGAAPVAPSPASFSSIAQVDDDDAAAPEQVAASSRPPRPAESKKPTVSASPVAVAPSPTPSISIAQVDDVVAPEQVAASSRPPRPTEGTSSTQSPVPKAKKPTVSAAPAAAAPSPSLGLPPLAPPRPPSGVGPLTPASSALVDDVLQNVQKTIELKHDLLRVKHDEHDPKTDAAHRKELHHSEHVVEEAIAELNEELEVFSLDSILNALEAVPGAVSGTPLEVKEFSEVLQESLNTADLTEVLVKLATVLVSADDDPMRANVNSTLALESALATNNVAELQAMAHELAPAIKNTHSQIALTHGSGEQKKLKAKEVLQVKQKDLLEAAVKTAGGWRSAVFLENGDVDVDCDVTIWSVEDQVHILNMIKDQLQIKIMNERDRADVARRNAKAASSKIQSRDVNFGANEKKKLEKQEEIHKQIRSLWEMANSVASTSEFGGDGLNSSESKGASREASREEGEVGGGGGGASALTPAEGPESEVPVNADDHHIFKTMETDAGHLEKVHDVFSIVEKSQEQVDSLRGLLEKKGKECEELKKEVKEEKERSSQVVVEEKAVVDPALLNELEQLRAEIGNREELMDQLKNAVRSKEMELSLKDETLARSLKDGASRTDQDLEQLNAMKKSAEASERTTGLLKRRVGELELSERGFQDTIKAYMQKEKDLESDMHELQEKMKADEWALKELEGQIMNMGNGDAKKLLEKVAKAKAKEFSKYGGLMERLAKEREENLLLVMKSHQWVHHVPQVVFNGVAYSSLVEWANEKREKMETMGGNGGGGGGTGKGKRFEDMGWKESLHLEGKVHEEMKQKLTAKDMEQYFGGGGVFFVTSDMAGARGASGHRSRKGSPDRRGGGEGTPLVQYRHAADVDQQPYGPWGRHPQLRYPYSDPSSPGDGLVEISGEHKGPKKEDVLNKGGKNDGYRWSTSFSGARKEDRKEDKAVPVRRVVQQTWLAKKKPDEFAAPGGGKRDKAKNSSKGLPKGLSKTTGGNNVLPDIKSKNNGNNGNGNNIGRGLKREEGETGGAGWRPGTGGRLSPPLNLGMPGAWEDVSESRPGTEGGGPSLWEASGGGGGGGGATISMFVQSGAPPSDMVYTRSMGKLKGNGLSVRG